MPVRRKFGGHSGEGWPRLSRQMRWIMKSGWIPICLAACGVAHDPLKHGGPVPVESLSALGEGYRVAGVAPPNSPESVALWPMGGVVIVHGPPADVAVSDPVAAAVRRWVEDGGRLILQGGAVVLAHRLGFEGRPPDRNETVLWGYDERSRLGRYVAGYRLVTDTTESLAQGLVPEPGARTTFMVQGGEPAQVGVTGWSRYPPESGAVWGIFAEQRDARTGSSRDAVLVHWSVGRGDVVAAGIQTGERSGVKRLEPLERRGGDTAQLAERIRTNAAKLLRELIGQLLPGPASGDRAAGEKTAGDRATDGWGGSQGKPVQVRWSGLLDWPGARALSVAGDSVAGGSVAGDAAAEGAASPVPLGKTGQVPGAVSGSFGRGVAAGPVRALVMGKGDAPRLPGRSHVAHWGWRVHANLHQVTRQPMAPDSVRQRVVLPAMRAGADLLDLGLVDARRGLPMPWLVRDPLRRPNDYRGDAFWPEWSAARVRGMAQDIASRGGLLQLSLDPIPLASRDLKPRLAMLRWLARELLDPRLHGASRLAGFGLGSWPGDRRGLAQQFIQDHAPGAYLMGLHPPNSAQCVGRDPLDGIVGALPALRGQPFGMPARGVAADWRGVGDPGTVHVAVLDAHTRGPDAALWGNQVAPVGSYGDWVVRQAQDFLRPRLVPFAGSGSEGADGRWAAGGSDGFAPVLAWDAWNQATLDPETKDYVQAVSLGGLDAALAMRLWATGVGGARDLMRAQSRTPVQFGFGAGSELPAHTPVLQNNHFRLAGSGGALHFDPTGLADFAGPEALEVSPRFRSTRFRGVPPSPPEETPQTIDLLAAGAGDTGGYQSVLEIERGNASSRLFPRVLARHRAPEWPQVVRVSCRPVTGSYVLNVTLRGVSGRGFVEFRRDGELLHLIPFETGRVAGMLRFPVSLTRSAVRQLEFGIVAGDAVAVEHLELEPVQELATEAWIEDPGGHRAVLAEQTASPYQDQVIRLATVAGLPGFTLWDDRQRAERGLFHKTVFPFPGLRRLALTGEGDNPRRLQQPFLLRGEGQLAVAVVPLSLARYEGFRLDPAEGLVLEGPIRPFQAMGVGFYLLDLRRWSGELDRGFLRDLQTVLQRVAMPRGVAPGPTGARFEHPLDRPWVEVVQMDSRAGTPVRVREGGYWLHRGVQPVPGRPGFGWVRIHHQPGHAVELRTGASRSDQAVLPAPGSLHCVAVGEPEEIAGATAVTIQVAQLSPLTQAPAVRFPQLFDEATVNGQPWAYHDGQTVHLPLARGEYRVRVVRNGAPEAPRLLGTRLDVRACRYDRGEKELRVTALREPGRPPAAPAVVWVSGPEPTSWVGCAPVPAGSMIYGSAAEGIAADRAGRLFLVEPGEFVLRYGPEAQGSPVDAAAGAPSAGRDGAGGGR